MINFSCDCCGKTFSVADDWAGRLGTCKGCGTPVAVPEKGSAANASLPPAARRRLPVRTRRLMADADAIRRAFQEFPLIRIQRALGNPPDRYEIIYKVRGLQRGPEGAPVVRVQHAAKIALTLDYPRQSPQCRMLTPVFHPNIEPGTICVGDHWTAGERLVDLIIRIGELITYQAYNIKSPLDGEAAMWADQNAHRLPIDARDLRPPNME
jgi:ubiquitin-protein ligase